MFSRPRSAPGLFGGWFPSGFTRRVAVLALCVAVRAEPVADPFENPPAAPRPAVPAAAAAAKPAAPALPDLPVVPPPDGPAGFLVDLSRRHQAVESFGASDAWHSDIIGRSWPEEIKREVARLLFSLETDERGSPRGIGLSLWRFNVGAGSAEQGDASGIAAMGHGPGPTRVECFLAPDGSYDWTKQAGQRWFLQAAKAYGVERFVAFSNSPPVQFTRTGKATSDGATRANLKPEHVADFARFLGEVLEHFQKREGIVFRQVSPVNEPQWRWNGGQQEGSPYTNAEIKSVAVALDAEIRRRGLATRMTIPEAGDLRYVYEGRNSHAGRQAYAFFDPDSSDYVGDLPTIERAVAAHSYFSDGQPEEFVDVRRRLREELLRHGLRYVMSEYCLLRDGLGKTTRNRPIPPIDSALQLARIIHSDLVEADAVSWQFWTAVDTQRDPNFGLRYYLIDRALDRPVYQPTKLLWTLGHFSRFIRPGYVRLETKRADGLDAVSGANREMLSAYASPDGKELVLVAINWRPEPVVLELKLKDGDGPAAAALAGRRYLTTADPGVNLRREQDFSGGEVALPPRSLTTLVVPLR